MPVVESVDPIVQALVSGTNGIAYEHLIGNLPRYPIPAMRLPPGRGEYLLDIGCGWGRWCVAAARNGYRPVGIDCNEQAVRAAVRVCRQLGVSADLVVADVRQLPFRNEAFHVAYSYSILQHFSDDDVSLILAGARRSVKDGGRILIQFAGMFGIRCLYHQIRRAFREPRGFEVRYRTLRSLRELTGGETISADCYFGLGLQECDADLMPWWLRQIFRASGFLRRMSVRFPGLVHVADSVFVECQAGHRIGARSQHL